MKISRWIVLFFLINSSAVFAGPSGINIKNKTTSASIYFSKNCFQQKIRDTIVIRFDYKQSALFHAFTFNSLDSIISFMLKNPAITLSIDGYAYKDEGNDTICYYLSLNRALFIQTYVLGRGIDSSRILAVKGFGKADPLIKKIDKDGLIVNVRAELIMNYPPPPKRPEIEDRDEDGIVDRDDKCPDVFGYKDNNGCPGKDAVIVPFPTQESALYAATYKVLDSVIAILTENPALSISIEGHAYKAEGINAVCDRLAKERAEIVKQYLLSRLVNLSRINDVKSYSNTRPLNAGKNPREIDLNSRAEIFFTGR